MKAVNTWRPDRTKAGSVLLVASMLAVRANHGRGYPPGYGTHHAAGLPQSQLINNSHGLGMGIPGLPIAQASLMPVYPGPHPSTFHRKGMTGAMAGQRRKMGARRKKQDNDVYAGPTRLDQVEGKVQISPATARQHDWLQGIVEDLQEPRTIHKRIVATNMMRSFVASFPEISQVLQARMPEDFKTLRRLYNAIPDPNERRIKKKGGPVKLAEKNKTDGVMYDVNEQSCIRVWNIFKELVAKHYRKNGGLSEGNSFEGIDDLEFLPSGGIKSFVEDIRNVATSHYLDRSLYPNENHYSGTNLGGGSTGDTMDDTAIERVRDRVYSAIANQGHQGLMQRLSDDAFQDALRAVQNLPQHSISAQHIKHLRKNTLFNNLDRFRNTERALAPITQALCDAMEELNSLGSRKTIVAGGVSSDVIQWWIGNFAWQQTHNFQDRLKLGRLIRNQFYNSYDALTANRRTVTSGKTQKADVLRSPVYRILGAVEKAEEDDDDKYYDY